MAKVHGVDFNTTIIPFLVKSLYNALFTDFSRVQLTVCDKIKSWGGKFMCGVVSLL